MDIPPYFASRAERHRLLLADSIVPDPMATINHAITIKAPPDRVWGWLVQMGAGRAGWYSYDRVDNGGMPSAWRLLPEYQHVAPGDILPAIPGAMDAFVVTSLDVARDLVLTVPGEGGRSRLSWEFFLDPLDDDRTRLIVRGRVSRHWLDIPQDRSKSSDGSIFIERVYRVLAVLPRPILLALAGVGHCIMQARQLAGIKRRAEA